MLFHLKHAHSALWNGNQGGEMVRIKNDKMKEVISFERENKGDKIITIVNLSNDRVATNLETQSDKGTYKELFTNNNYSLTGKDSVDLAAWSYLVLIKQ